MVNTPPSFTFSLTLQKPLVILVPYGIESYSFGPGPGEVLSTRPMLDVKIMARLGSEDFYASSKTLCLLLYQMCMAGGMMFGMEHIIES